MKKLFFVFVLFLITGLFAANQADAQALVVKGGVHTLTTPAGDVYVATKSLEVITPSGNFLMKATWLIVPDDFFPEKGVKKVNMWGIFEYPSGDIEVFDANGMFYPNGKIVVLYHLNGSGAATPGNGEIPPPWWL